MTGILALATLAALATPATAQLMPADIAPGLLHRAVHENYAERARDRQRGKVAKKSVAEVARERDCAARWQRHGKMGRAESIRLYDECPR